MENLALFAKCLVVVESMSAVCGLLTWHKWKSSHIKWFVLYLCMISMLEITNLILQSTEIHHGKNMLYLFVVPFEVLFIHWFFLRTIPSKSTWIYAGGIIYLISLLVENTVFGNGAYYFESLSYSVGNLFILIYIILFFLAFVNSDKLLQFQTQITFWISTGMLLFYSGTFPFFGLYNELAKDINLFILFAWGETALNYTMYILFSIGLLWGKPD